MAGQALCLAYSFFPIIFQYFFSPFSDSHSVVCSLDIPNLRRSLLLSWHIHSLTSQYCSINAASNIPYYQLSYKLYHIIYTETPAGQLPCLDVDGEMISQSTALATYLARQFGEYVINISKGYGIDNLYENFEIDA